MFRCAADHEVYLYVLRHVLSEFPVDVHAYVLMTTHVHMMVTPGSPGALPGVMQALGRRYVRYFNDRYERCGTLFNGRYKSLPVDDERYWFTCMRYIELNPVRAGLASTPDAYRWSSYRRHATGARDMIVTPHPLYLALGHSSSDRERSWRGLCGAPLPDEDLAEIRGAVQRGRLPARVVFPDTIGV
jgi:putative transposase